MKLGIRVRKHTLLILSLQNLILFAISKCDNLCTSTFSFVITFIFGAKMEICIEDSLIRCWFQFFFFLIRCLWSLLYPVNTVSIDCLWSSSNTEKKKKRNLQRWRILIKRKKKGKRERMWEKKDGWCSGNHVDHPNTILFSIRLFLLFSLQIYQQSSPVPLSVSSLLF